MENFKYLGSVIHAQGENEENITARIAAAWKKWRELSGVLCDRRMPVAVKGKVYRTVVRPVLIYGSETWALKRREEERLERTEMRMLRWILGLTLRNKKKNDDICRILGVACITDKVREARSRWFGHVQRREEEDYVRRILEADVRGQRSRGRQRKKWIDVVKYNMEDFRLDLVDVENRAEWRGRTRVADPSPEGSTTWGKEREAEGLRTSRIYNFNFFPSKSYVDWDLFLPMICWNDATVGKPGRRCACRYDGRSSVLPAWLGLDTIIYSEQEQQEQQQEQPPDNNPNVLQAELGRKNVCSYFYLTTDFCRLFLISVFGVLPVYHNLTSLKRDDQNVARVCVHHSFSGRTYRRSRYWNNYVSTRWGFTLVTLAQ